LRVVDDEEVLIMGEGEDEDEDEPK